jgi:hypothetical protein
LGVDPPDRGEDISGLTREVPDGFGQTSELPEQVAFYFAVVVTEAEGVPARSNRAGEVV